MREEEWEESKEETCNAEGYNVDDWYEDNKGSKEDCKEDWGIWGSMVEMWNIGCHKVICIRTVKFSGQCLNVKT